MSVSVGDTVTEFNSFTGFIVFRGIWGWLRVCFAGLQWCWNIRYLRSPGMRTVESHIPKEGRCDVSVARGLLKLL